MTTRHDTHPLALSSRLIDDGVADTQPNRITEELSELAEGVAVVESFSHVVAVDTGDGLVVFDSSGRPKGAAVVAALRRWRTDPVHTLVYTHGHLDHVGGSGAFVADAEERGHARPDVVAQERLVARFERYRETSGYNQVINGRQFGGAVVAREGETDRPFLPTSVADPSTTYDAELRLSIGDLEFHLHHCLGETDDHTWTWIPEHRMISAGDQFIWNFPNCGNPQKVQRYPREWARSLREMAAKEPELFVPAHGLPIEGRERIATCLTTVADTLDDLVDRVVAAMNEGAVLDEIVHEVTVDESILQLPYLRPLYDEPEFVVRNIWRLYGGWWDGDPARLKPPRDAALAAEIADLAGGVEALVERAERCSAADDHRMACQLVEFAVAAEPDAELVHRARREIYRRRRGAERSLMAKGIYLSAANESERVLTGESPPARFVLEL